MFKRNITTTIREGDISHEENDVYPSRNDS